MEARGGVGGRLEARWFSCSQKSQLTMILLKSGFSMRQTGSCCRYRNSASFVMSSDSKRLAPVTRQWIRAQHNDIYPFHYNSLVMIAEKCHGEFYWERCNLRGISDGSISVRTDDQLLTQGNQQT